MVSIQCPGGISGKILYDLLKEEITVFVSTAYLDEAERCTRIGLIHKGNILMVNEPSAIRESLEKPMMRFLHQKHG